jgi:hypothetical protein
MFLMTGALHRRIRAGLVFALCAVWAAMPLLAQVCAATVSHCHHQMPCCPRTGDSRDCSPGLCPAQVSQRVTENKPLRDLAEAQLALLPIMLERQVFQESICALQMERHSSPPVFQLKDELRI